MKNDTLYDLAKEAKNESNESVCETIDLLIEEIDSLEESVTEWSDKYDNEEENSRVAQKELEEIKDIETCEPKDLMIALSKSFGFVPSMPQISEIESYFHKMSGAKGHVITEIY